MSEARDVILERMRMALRDAPTPVLIPRDYRRTTSADLDLVERFAERVADYRATVHRATPATLAEIVAGVLREGGVRRLVVPAGVPDGWLAATSASGSGIEIVADQPPLAHLELDAIDGVLTGCAVAIAETGTIVLDAGSGQGRRALTLLPDRHLCVVLAHQIVGDVPEAVARLDPVRPLTWISGPSATSDIELERVEGVHGPRILDVVMVVG
ncbi:MAG: lactate utilization protein C [Candidatus Limnocylindrales bacterium]